MRDPFRQFFCLFLATVILFSISSPVFASGGTDFIVTSYWLGGGGSTRGGGAGRRGVNDYLPAGISPDDATDSDLRIAYSAYTTDLTAELGTATLIDGGVRIYYASTSYQSSGVNIDRVNVGLTSSGSGVSRSTTDGYIVLPYQKSLYTAPFACSYLGGIESNYVGCHSDFLLNNGLTPLKSVVAGKQLYWCQNFGNYLDRIIPDAANSAFSFSCRYYVDIFPTSGATGDYYDIDISNSTRPTVITGPVGYYDASNNLQVVNDTTIVNETNNSYYNPVTNTSTDISYWSYDYSDRSYHLTLATGDTTTVTYGDEYIVIQEGDVIYNIYYVIQGGGSGEGGSSCNHNYTSAVTTEPGCTTKGITTYTCDLCGHKYTEYIDALGHDWQATEEVPTTYALPESAHCPTCQGTSFTHELNASHDEYTCTCSNPDCGATWAETPVTTYGYTIYTCSRCGATQKDSEDPDSGLFTALGNFLADGIDWIVDKLVQLIDSIAGINEIFTEYVEQMKEKAGEYPAFISAFIAIMPEDLMTVVWFGVIAAVVLAVWKKWFN